MKNTTTRIFILSFIGLFVGNATAIAQDLGDIFIAGPDDANRYLQKYTEVIGQSFNSGLGSGWYNTAKPHKMFGVDLTATLNIATIPDSELRFNFNEDDFENLQFESGDEQLPSLVGGNSNTMLTVPANTTITGGDGSTITYQNSNSFQAPDGLIDANDFPFIGTPVAAIQLGIGLVKNTDLKIRYASDFGAVDDGSIRLIGFGVMHDLKQWIPGLKQIPVDVSGFLGYTSFKVEVPFDVDAPGLDAPNGLGELKANSTTIQLVASKQISVITPYLGIGYNIAGSRLAVNGDFTYTEGPASITLTDPIDLNFKGGSTPRVNLGLRIKLLVLTLHAEYAVQKYNTLTLGVGISVR